MVTKPVSAMEVLDLAISRALEAVEDSEEGMDTGDPEEKSLMRGSTGSPVAPSQEVANK